MRTPSISNVPFTCEVLTDEENDKPSCVSHVAWEVIVEHPGYATTHYLCQAHLDEELPILQGDSDVRSILMVRWTAEVYLERCEAELTELAERLAAEHEARKA